MPKARDFSRVFFSLFFLFFFSLGGVSLLGVGFFVGLFFPFWLLFFFGVFFFFFFFCCFVAAKRA